MLIAAIAERAIGQYPASIATSLALESANGIHPEIKVRSPPVREFQELWVNLRTLYRNFMGSLDRTAAKTVGAADIALVILEEMETISSVMREAVGDKFAVHYYLSDYGGLELKYPRALIRTDNTDLQREYTSLQNQALTKVLQLVEPGLIYVFNREIKPPHPTKALILTHYAYDLLSHKSFQELVLVESHTGAIKRKAQWYTKYHDGKNLSMIPFREDLLQVFGDSETFRPQPASWRKALIDTATKYSWSQVSTKDRIKFGIDQLKDPDMRAALSEMLVS